MLTLEEIREYKKKLGYSTRQLSELSAVPLGTLQKILQGETKTPRYHTMQALERVLLRNEQGYKENHQSVSYTAQGQETNLVAESVAAYRFDSAPSKNKAALEKKAGEKSGLSQKNGDYYEGIAGYPEFEGWMGKRQGEFTVSDYYALPDDICAELIDGRLFRMDSPSFVHQSVAGEVYHQLLTAIKKNNGKCRPMMSPLDIRLDEDEFTMLQPDLLILCDEKKIRRWGVMGAPDFVLEVISMSSMKRDFVIKMSKYMNAGVREYWMVDPINKRLIVVLCDEDMPYIGPLSGKRGLHIYDAQVEVDLDALAALIVEYPE